MNTNTNPSFTAASSAASSATSSRVIRGYIRETPIRNLDENGVVKLRTDGLPFLGEPFGVMVASLENNKLKFGWSLCHEKDMAKHAFDKKKGIMIAEKRMKSFNPDTKDLIVPNDLVEDMEDFILRAKRYFRTDCDIQIQNGFEVAIEKRMSGK